MNSRQHPYQYHRLTGPPSSLAATDAKVMAVGKFDGLHIAHQAILARAVERSQCGGGTPCIFSFSPHPRYAIQKDAAYDNWLTPILERSRLALTYGIAKSYVAEFDERFRNQTADEFICNYLLPLGVKEIVVGYDFRFGKGGAYSTEDLCITSERRGMRCEVVEHVDQDGEPVSSSRIREALQVGDVGKARRLLGRNYQLRGKVSKGDQRGRTIGFPTANLELTERFVVPEIGVYAVDCELSEGQIHRGIMNIGIRPTVEVNGAVSLEVHILDFAQDLYGEEVVVHFLSRIREERKFASLEELKTQLSQDAIVGRAFSLYS